MLWVDPFSPIDMSIAIQKDLAGEDLRFSHRLSRTENRTAKEYAMGGQMFWPPGNVQISHHASRSVTANLNSAECLSFKEFQLRQSELLSPPFCS